MKDTPNDQYPIASNAEQEREIAEYNYRLQQNPPKVTPPTLGESAPDSAWKVPLAAIAGVTLLLLCALAFSEWVLPHLEFLK